MHRLASTNPGATMAWVGHTSMHAVHWPQWSVTGSDTGSGIFKKISPKKTWNLLHGEAPSCACLSNLAHFAWPIQPLVQALNL